MSDEKKAQRKLEEQQHENQTSDRDQTGARNFKSGAAKQERDEQGGGGGSKGGGGGQKKGGPSTQS